MRRKLIVCMAVIVLSLIHSASAFASVASGKCGNNLTWTLDDDGNLTITGTGEMYDYDEDSPWWDCRNSVKTVTISEGITKIGEDAFHDCGSLSSVEISNTVTSIQRRAFFNCKGLTSIVCHRGVYPPKCESKTVFSGVDKTNCVLYVPAESLSKYMQAEAWTDFTNISAIDKKSGRCGNNIVWALDENGNLTLTGSGAMYDYDFDYEEYTPWGRSIKSASISDGIIYIGSEAFKYCHSLQKVEIPGSVYSIGRVAFQGCDGLTSIVCQALWPPKCISDSFFGVDVTNCVLCAPAISISKYKEADAWKNFMNISEIDQIFGECGDEIIWMLDKNGNLTLTGTGAMCDYDETSPWWYVRTSLKKVTISEGITKIGEGAFDECEGLSSVDIPNTVTSIQRYAFWSCKSLTSIVCQAVTPPICDTNTFYIDMANCVLYVPKESIDAYKNAEVWSGFKSIQAYHSPDEPDTDVSQIDNAIYMDKAESRPGTTIELPLKMKNTASIVGFQCDFVAPDNTSVPTDENGDYRIALSTERTTEKKTNIFATGLQTDGSIRILASSTKNTPFSGNDGVVATVSLHIDKDIQAGEYPVALRNVVVTDGNGTTYSTEYVKTTLTVTITPGDVNGDDKINVGDIAMVSNYIMGISQPAFIKQAADINGDGDINVGDLSSIVELIIGGAPAMAPVQKTSANTRSGASETTHDKSIYAEDATFADGSATLSVQMKDDVDVVSYQFDIELPAGIEVPKDEDDYYLIDLSTKRTTARKHNIFESGLQTDGSIRVLCASATNAIFTGDEGEICTITLNRSDNLAPGNYTVKLKNIVIASKESTGIQTYYLENTTATIVVPGEVNDAGNATELKSGANKVNFALQGVKWHGGILYACSVAESVEKSEPTTSSVDMDRYEDRNYAEFEQRDWVAIGGVDSEYEGMELSAGFVAEYADGVLTPSESIAKTPASSSYVPNTYRTENILHGGYANYSADDYKAYYVPVKENEVARFMGYVETVNGAKYLYSNNANGRIGGEGVKIDGQIADNPCDDFRNDYSLLEGILVSDATTKSGVKIIMLTDLGKATGVETVDASSVRIYATTGNIVLVAASEGSAQVFDYSGRLLRQIPIEAGCSYSVPVQPGFYLVKVGNVVKKIMVK